MADHVSFETVEVWIDEHKFVVKLAENAQQRRQGLAGRTTLDVDGMLFTYQYPVYRPFYMRHTYLPLVIAFFDEDGDYLGSRQMTPLSENPVLPPRPFQYAIEFPLGKEPVLCPGSRLKALSRSPVNT